MGGTISNYLINKYKTSNNLYNNVVLTEYQELLNTDFTINSDYIEACTLKYIYNNKCLKNKLDFYNSEYTFIRDHQCDIMITKATIDNQIQFLKEYLDIRNNSILKTKIISNNKVHQILTSDLNTYFFYKEDIYDGITVEIRERYIFNDEIFIEKEFDDNNQFYKFNIYTPDGVLYCSCLPDQIELRLIQFMNKYGKEIHKLTYKERRLFNNKIFIEKMFDDNNYLCEINIYHTDGGFYCSCNPNQLDLRFNQFIEDYP
jgi:hypothetical protein